MDRQVDGRGGSGRFHPRSYGKCHRRVDKRRRDAAVQYAARLAEVVAHIDLDYSLVDFQTG